MQKQKQILNQKLSLGPLQIQFLNLLQIPIVDLDKRIEKEIEENPAIEEHDEDDLNSEKIIKIMFTKTVNRKQILLLKILPEIQILLRSIYTIN